MHVVAIFSVYPASASGSVPNVSPACELVPWLLGTLSGATKLGYTVAAPNIGPLEHGCWVRKGYLLGS